MQPVLQQLTAKWKHRNLDPFVTCVQMLDVACAVQTVLQQLTASCNHVNLNHIWLMCPDGSCGLSINQCLTMSWGPTGDLQTVKAYRES